MSKYLSFSFAVASVFFELICISGCDPQEKIMIDDTEFAGNIPPRYQDELDSDVEEVSSIDVGVMTGPCELSPCSASERCEEVDGEARCIALGCEVLSCADNQRCEDHSDGARCVDIRCSTDADCLPEEYCDSECVPDICQPGEQRCVNDFEVQQCDARGATFELRYECSVNRSTCVIDQGKANCSCDAEWDCPPYMRCDAGRCQGRPEAPSCTLPPIPFAESLPTLEMSWGGDALTPIAVGHPFSESSQVVQTPIIANLNDDNGDGIVDEQDVPDLIFLSFCDEHRLSFTRDGVLRAVSGGGVSRGEDLWAVLGDQHWKSGDSLPNETICTNADLDSTATPAVGDLDDPLDTNGLPEILAIHEDNGLVIFNHLGERISAHWVGEFMLGANPAISIANVDQQGFAEAIIGNTVITFGRDMNGVLTAIDQFKGIGTVGFSGNRGERNGQGPVSCVANILGDERLEIIGGGTVYGLPRGPAGANRRADCVSEGGDIVPEGDEEEAFCAGQLIVYWDALAVNGPTVEGEGFCAVADVLGANIGTPIDPLEEYTEVAIDAPPSLDEPLDGTPEVVLVSLGAFYVLDGETGQLRAKIPIDSRGDRGGPPNVDDFDGDGFPEIGSAFAQGYIMLDLQAPTDACPAWPIPIPEEDLHDNIPPDLPLRLPGPMTCSDDNECANGARCIHSTCRCLHNGWRRVTEDDSSKVTGSTLFDFNGDGRAEVIYNDECFFRIYDGMTGDILFRQPSESRTRIEYPVVADVDNDGNAEIIFSTSNESEFCSLRQRMEPELSTLANEYNTGIEVWGDPTDSWVSTRRIWNQHSYHVTQVTESGQVPLIEPAGWIPTNGRRYNSYRSQPPNVGIAPDLQVSELSATSGTICGQADSVLISFRVLSAGEVRIPSGIQVQFSGRWSDDVVRPLLDVAGQPLTYQLQSILRPGEFELGSLTYAVSDDSSRPQNAELIEVFATVDPAEDGEVGVVRECDENNNSLSTPVTLQEDGLAELSIEIEDATSPRCPLIQIQLSIRNQGVRPVNQLRLNLYAGDPRNGGLRVGTRLLEEPVESGETAQLTWTEPALPAGRMIQFFVAIDPNNEIAECNEEDNLIALDPSTCIQEDAE